MIYLDNAATTIKKPDAVYDAVLDAMKHCGNSGRGASDASLDASRKIYEARMCLAEFFGGDDEARLVFTANATEALNIAIHGLFEPGEHVITTQLEHNSVLRPLYMQRERGGGVDIVPCSDAGIKRGIISPSDIEALIRPDTKAIVCTHASNLTGNVVDIKSIGQIARKHNLLFIVDASQTAGVLPINIREMNIDVLCFTGHKGLMGPQGTGGLYVGERADIKPFKSGGTGVLSFLENQPMELPTRLEAGTLNGPGIAGLLTGVMELEKIGLDNIYAKEHELMQAFMGKIKTIPGIRIYGDFDVLSDNGLHCAIVSVNIADMDSAEVSDILMNEYGIATRSGIHCAPLMHKFFGTQKQGMVRFSFSYYNTVDEINEAAEALMQIAALR